MKTTPRSRAGKRWVLVALGICFAVFVAVIAPNTSEARARLENTQPLAGDPDVTDSPSPGPGKALKSAQAMPTPAAAGKTRVAHPSSWSAWVSLLAALRGLVRV